MGWDSGRLIGKNTVDNQVDTSSVTADANGSILERLEYVQSSIGAASPQFEAFPSLTTVVEEDRSIQFNVSIFGKITGAVPSADIDITGISSVMYKSTYGGGGFSATGITQPTFSKTTGSVYCEYMFVASEWMLGDVYKLVLSGITATVSGSTVYVPDVVWSSIVLNLFGMDVALAAVPSSTGSNTWNATALASIEAECEDALQAKDLDHLANTADGGTNVYPDSVVQDSILAYLMSKGNPALATSYNNTTDSLEALSDKLSLGAGSCQVFEKSITSAANAGDVTIATITTQPCLIESVVVHAVSASQTDLTSAAVSGGSSKVITFLSTAATAVANLNAVDDQVAWTGAVRLPATKTIVMSLVGTGATAVNLNVTIKYRACVAGGYLV